jgi:histidine triad (HIT) family protein
VDDACVFDRIIAGDLPAHVVLREGDVVAFLDARPVFPGHTLVVPREHHRHLADLPGHLLGPMFEAARRVAAAQRSALGNAGTWIALNDVISQSVPHVHLHVVPRRPRDGLRGFFWPRQRYADEAEAASVAAALRSAVEPAS